MKGIYIAAPVPFKVLAADLKQRLDRSLLNCRELKVRASWITARDTGYAHGNLREKVVRDFREIDDSLFIVVLYLPGSGGGMFTEMGYALAKNIPVYCFQVIPSELGKEEWVNKDRLARGLAAHHSDVRWFESYTMDDVFVTLCGVIAALVHPEAR